MFQVSSEIKHFPIIFSKKMEQNSNVTNDVHQQPQLSQFVNTAVSPFWILKKYFAIKTENPSVKHKNWQFGGKAILTSFQ